MTKSFKTLAIFFLSISFVFAKNTWISFDNSTDKIPVVEVLSADQNETVIRFQLYGFYTGDIEIQGDNYTKFSIPSLRTLHKKGLPDFPKFSESLIISDDGGTNIEVVMEKWFDFDFDTPAPSKGVLSREIDPSTIPHTFNDIYFDDSEYPQVNAKLNAPYILRDFRGQTVHFTPFKWNPVDNHYQICSEMIIKIYQTDAAGENTKTKTRDWSRISTTQQNLYHSHFINFEQLNNNKYSTVAEEGRLIMITYDDFIDDVQEFAQWKIQKGIETDVVALSTIGSSTTNIKNYLQDEYDSYKSFAFCILVGDAQQIPTIQAGSPSDGSYCLLEGNDYYADAFISRISAQTSDVVLNQIDKFINYEKNPDIGSNGDWYAKGIGIASDESGGTELTDWERMDLLRDMLLGYTYSDVAQIYDPGASSSTVINNVNTGSSIINYIGHGSGTSWSTTGFSVSHVGQLSNENRNPLILDVSCSNGAFTGYSDCLAEAWLKAGSENNPKGAVAMFSASTSASWVPPCVMQSEAVEMITTEQMQSMGGITFHGIFATLDEYSGNDGIEVMEQYNIFGDCSMIMRTTNSAGMNVSHLPILPIGSQNFDVTVSGVNGARVTLSKDGILYGTGVTNVSGQVSILLQEDVSEPMNLTLTVTGYNRTPYITEIQAIAPDGPWLTFDGYSIDDSEFGNGNGQWDFGESIKFNVALKNVGADTAYNPSVELICNDELVTLTQDSSSYPDADSAGIIENIFAFEAGVDIDVENGHYVEFQVVSSANDSLEWITNFSIPVLAPIVNILEINLNVMGGNGDAVFDPGETAKLVVSLINDGGSITQDIDGQIFSSDDYLTIQQDHANFGILFPDGGTVNNASYPFVLSAGQNTPMGHEISLELLLDDENGFTKILPISIILGFPEILIWDKDENHNSAVVMQTLLEDSLDKTIDYSSGNLPNEVLNNYRAIFIFLGVSPNTHELTNSEAAILCDFLDQGGNIYMEGGETWYYDSQTSLHSYFNITGTSDGSADAGTILGEADGYAKGLQFTYNGDNNYMDRITSVSPAIAVFKNQTPSYVNTIAYDAETYKAIGASFEFGGLVDGGDSSNKEFLLKKMLEFFEIGTTMPGLCDSYIKGDPDNNYIINVLDIVKIVGKILTTIELDTCRSWACDINADSVVNINDLIPMVNIILNNVSKDFAKRCNDIASNATIVHDGNSFSLESDGLVAAVQLTLQTDRPEEIHISPAGALNQMSWLTSKKDNCIKMIVYSLEGKSLPANTELFQISGNVKISNILMANVLGDPININVKEIPLQFTLGKNYPNPFNPTTMIPFTIPVKSEISLKIYNIAGQELETLLDKSMEPGQYNIRWDASHYSSGIYIYKLKSGDRLLTRKLVLIK